MVRESKKVGYILIVDDDEVTSYLHHLIIQQTELGDQILNARNGEEALNILQEICVENNSEKDDCRAVVVFLDINMPVMDGFTFLDKFEKLKSEVKNNIHIIIVTTSNNERDIDKANQYDIADYVTKPLTEEKLIDIFNNLPQVRS